MKECLISLLFYVLGSIFFLFPAQAQTNYHSVSPAAPEQAGRQPRQPAAEEPQDEVRSFTVTSIEKCYALLSREDALDIQQNYIKPYQECQRRLALKLKKTSVKAGEGKDSEGNPGAARGFYRVQKKDAPSSESAEQKKSVAVPDVP